MGLHQMMLAAFTVVMSLLGIVEKERMPKSIYWLGAMFGMCFQVLGGDAS